MKASVRSLLKIYFIIMFLLAAASLQAADTQPASKPVAVVPETVYEFPDTVDGQYVLHDFVIRNQGNAVLNVIKVNTTWGCTAASVPGPIPPGKEGIVTLKVSTSGKGGHELDKTVSVVTDDPVNAIIRLTVKGKVIEIYSLSPRTVKLKGVVGETVKDTIHLVPNKAYEFKVLGITAKRGENIRVQYKEVKNGDLPGYDITVENTAKTAGVYFDTLLVKTDSKQKPQINISVIGSIREPAQNTTATNGG